MYIIHIYIIYIKESWIKSKLKGGPRKKALSGEHVKTLKSLINEDASIALKSLEENLVGF